MQLSYQMSLCQLNISLIRTCILQLAMSAVHIITSYLLVIISYSYNVLQPTLVLYTFRKDNFMATI